MDITEARNRALSEYPLTPLEKNRRMWMVNAMGSYVVGYELMLHIDSSDVRRVLGIGALAAGRYVMQRTQRRRDRDEEVSGTYIRSDQERHTVDAPKPDIVMAAALFGTLLLPAVGISHASVDIFRAHSHNRQSKRMVRTRDLFEEASAE